MTSTSRKPRFARFVDQIVLATLTFEVDLDLGLRRLPDVHDGFPLQNGRGQKVSARHRRPPPVGRRPPPASGGWPELETILWRSGGCIIHSCGASNAITSWHGTSGLGFASIVSCRRFIRLLLGDSDFAGGASPKAAINEEPAQVLERRAINLRRAERRGGAGRRI